jgi:hypothetical protein
MKLRKIREMVVVACPLHSPYQILSRCEACPHHGQLTGTHRELMSERKVYCTYAPEQRAEEVEREVRPWKAKAGKKAK